MLSFEIIVILDWTSPLRAAHTYTANIRECLPRGIAVYRCYPDGPWVIGSRTGKGADTVRNRGCSLRLVSMVMDTTQMGSDRSLHVHVIM